VQAHNVKVIKGPWNEMYLSEMHNFPEAKHDDVTDASDGAFNELIKIGGSYHAYN
jgi:predicted phage terminase large subunit-like protein